MNTPTGERWTARGLVGRLSGATQGVVVLILSAGTLTATLRPAVATVALATAVFLAGTVIYATRTLPDLLATVRRTRALGAAPALVGRLVLHLRVEPNLESAVAFAGEADGHLAEALARHARRARGTGGTGLDAFAEDWGERYPALARACSLVEAAVEVDPTARERTLARAMTVVKEGTRDRAAGFAADLRGPATALYAFGVLLPLALVGVLPAAGVAGVGVGLPALVVIYDIFLPVLVLGAGVRLLARRPVAFPPQPVPNGHPATEGRTRRAVAVAATAGGISAVVVVASLPRWFAFVLVPAVAVGAGLLAYTRPTVEVRRRVRETEAGVPDVLSIVGRRVTAGTSVERAIGDAAERIDGRAGSALRRAATRQRRLGLGVKRALVGDSGPLETLPSDRLAAAAALLDTAAREGPPAGEALVATAEHLDDLRAVERESRRAVERVTRTLSHTAAVFGPLVAGVTVGLGARLPARGTEVGSLGAEPLSPAGLGLAVGVYVCWLAVALPALATGLERGLDRTLVGYRIGGSLLAAGALYAAAYVATLAVT